MLIQRLLKCARSGHEGFFVESGSSRWRFLCGVVLGCLVISIGAREIAEVNLNAGCIFRV